MRRASGCSRDSGRRGDDFAPEDLLAGGPEDGLPVAGLACAGLAGAGFDAADGGGEDLPDCDFCGTDLGDADCRFARFGSR